MSQADLEYKRLAQDILDNGIKIMDRTGTGTISLVSQRMVFDLSKEFPILTTKKMAFKNAIREILWFIGGISNLNNLHIKVQPWWKDWADETGAIKGCYPEHFRNFNNEGIDQLAWVINEIKTNPNSRRLIISNWNVSQTLRTGCALPSCLPLIQFFIREDKIHAQLYQRSGDMLLGVPIDIVDYALLTHIMAVLTGYQVGILTHCLGDSHIYLPHTEILRGQILREPMPGTQLEIIPFTDLTEITEDHFKLTNYQSHPPLTGKLFV
jgi:thymidylate synthase